MEATYYFIDIVIKMDINEAFFNRYIQCVDIPDMFAIFTLTLTDLACDSVVWTFNVGLSSGNFIWSA